MWTVVRLLLSTTLPSPPPGRLWPVLCRRPPVCVPTPRRRASSDRPVTVMTSQSPARQTRPEPEAAPGVRRDAVHPAGTSEAGPKRTAQRDGRVDGEVRVRGAVSRESPKRRRQPSGGAMQAAKGGEQRKADGGGEQQKADARGEQRSEQNGSVERLQQGGRQQRPSVSGEEMLEKVRVWEPVSSKHRHPRQSARGPGHEFTMVSYNVLSQHLYDIHPELYMGAAPEHTAWSVRGPRLWQQLVNMRPDIVCLQEVEEGDIETFWRPRCSQEGFNILYKKRTGSDKWDGCAVLYRESVFSLRELATVEYMQPGCRALDRDNVGIVVRLRGAGGDLVVACTHLLYNPKRHDVKLAQVALLLAELDRVAWCGVQQTHLPVLLAGDLNLEPFSPVYQFLQRGWFEYGGLSRRQLTPFGGGEQLLTPLLPPQLGVNAFCRHAAVQLRRMHRPPESEAERGRAARRLLALQHSERRLPPPPLPLRQLAQEAAACCIGHGLRLGSVYRHGTQRAKEVTTCQSNWVTVDYIFQSISPPAGSVRLELVSRLALPTAAVCRRLLPYPSPALPSDHLPLAARFRLVPSAAWWPGHRS